MRTPLFRVMRRSLRLAQASRRSGQSPAEVVERWHEAARSRRAFLQATGTAAAGLALGCAARAPRAGGRGEPVVVVGAGIAGLCAAWRLDQSGVPVRVLEAQNRVGGRMFSLRGHFPEEQVVELGGELIDTGHEHLRALCGELGLALDDLSQEEDGIATDTFFVEGQRRGEAEIVEAFRPLAAALESARATLGDEITYRVPGGAEALDRVSIEEWLDTAGVRGWFRRLLSVAYTAEYGIETDRQSSLNFVQMIGGEAPPFRVFGESDERFHVRGGNDLVTTALARRLEGRIETNSVLESVAARSDGAFRLSVRRGGVSQVVDAPWVVLALPFTLLREVAFHVPLPPPKRKAIAELGYGANAKLMVGFKDRVWRATHRSNGSVIADLPFQSTWETSRKQAGRGGVLTNYTGGDHGLEIGQGSAAEQAAKMAAELEAVWPGVRAAREGMPEVRFHWPSHPWTKGSYAGYLVGQWTTICGAEGEPVGRLHFAGEHCSVEAQGFMEGGCATGQATAAAILAEMGVKKAAFARAG
ncbi:MAG TPA: FAD-dependent oxidoreductase [Vicinamibacteria bacterium]|jgi:monoamine oxidase